MLPGPFGESGTGRIAEGLVGQSAAERHGQPHEEGGQADGDCRPQGMAPEAGPQSATAGANSTTGVDGVTHLSPADEVERNRPQDCAGAADWT